MGKVTVLTTFRLAERRLCLRRAAEHDVLDIIGLLADDELGVTRDGLVEQGVGPYLSAFRSIDSDPAQLLLVAHDEPGRDEKPPPVLATMQLSFIPGLSRRGALRAQVEGVRVHADLRGTGLGRAMFSWAIEESRRRGCALVQLTSDKQRARAHGFYRDLGFEASHEGFKLTLDQPAAGMT